MIWSACSTVLRLWAMTIVVRFRPNLGDHRDRSTAAATSRLAEESSAAVGSSNTSTDGSRMRARAMAMRCFCPPENCDPLEPTKVLNLSGKLSTKVSCASRQALSTSSFETPHEPSMMFSMIEVAKRTGS
mmetsp:Transcript_6496/g.18646  ORF Transcript_6496/g.18646 Transcript_6496/m.18646 type:complete len:130 (-) Transcript_6496:1075-1464(-)